MPAAAIVRGSLLGHLLDGGTGVSASLSVFRESIGFGDYLVRECLGTALGIGCESLDGYRAEWLKDAPALGFE
ncbi:hypothetical protein VH13_07605 [Corynebacterium ulcerans]|nr:hypothetical protein VH13_07605 [Corynebacterium ulcerans]KKO85628.1 hypothetical protein VH15_09585 [Corynebacterium ulcerans]KPJ23902.1 hypothetical protein AOT31_06695 [Corynebacterium ulcerans]BDV26104.1 hypothetical protein CULTSU28_13520 [Corynebacterium ulcerans]